MSPQTMEDRLTLIRMALAEAGLDPEAAYKHTDGSFRYDTGRITDEQAWKAVNVTRTGQFICLRCFLAACDDTRSRDRWDPYAVHDRRFRDACQSFTWLTDDCGVSR